MSTSTTSNNPTTVTPARFTKEEKSILYELFHQNEDIIDIKFRRNSSKKNCSVRDCWDRIAEIYNNHPDTTTVRNVKQIQKFWLNARLRKHYPTGGGDASSNINKSASTTKQTKLMKKFETVNVIDTNIKFEKDCESEEIEMIQDDDNDMQHEVEISTSSNDVLLDNTTSTTTHQYNIDHISADKLTLNDLLEFKNSRSTRHGDEIVLQIKTPGDSLTSHAHHHHHQKDNNNIISSVGNGNNNNSSLQAYTTTSYRISNPTTATAILSEQYQTTPIVHQQQIIQQQPQLPHLHHKSTPIITSQQTCCSHNNNNSTNSSIISPNIDNNIEDKINSFRIKEAELKYKEEQLKLEQRKIELAQAKEVLKHMKELHVYQIEEMKLKLKLLSKGNSMPVVTVKKV